MHTKLKYEFEKINLDNSLVAVPVGEYASQFLGVIKLNESGAAIMEMLKDDISEEEIIKKLQDEYGEHIDVLTVDVHHFLSTLKERDLLI